MGGTMILNTIWPLIRDTLAAHPGDAKVVEKSCRVLKHSMRCIPDIFKPKVVEVASVLVPAFQQQQHSSYLYSAEILANTYASDPEVVPILTTLFHALSSTGLSCWQHKTAFTKLLNWSRTTTACSSATFDTHQR